MKVLEFRNMTELNEYIKDLDYKLIHSIIPIARMFDNPKTNMFTSTITYILVQYERG